MAGRELVIGGVHAVRAALARAPGDALELWLRREREHAAADGLEETAHTATVHQGALEKSNASAIEEMISMIAVQRSFERASSVLGMITDTYRRLSRLQ